MAFPDTEQDTFSVPQDRHADAPVTGEQCVVPAVAPYNVELAELPLRGSLVIAGLLEVDYVPTSATEFYCNYASATVTLHAAQAGAALEISYTGQGSVLRAGYIAALQQAIQLIQRTVFSLPASVAAMYAPLNPAGGNWRIAPDRKHIQFYDSDMAKWRNQVVVGGALGLSVEGYD